MAIRKLLTAGMVLASLVSCVTKPKTNRPTQEKPYFVVLPAGYQTGMAMISDDFDNDGDKDFIVGTISAEDNRYAAKLYFLENDGEGNFKLKVKEGEQ